MDQDIALMKGFAEARKLLRDRRVEAAGLDDYVWRKLDRIDKYLANEQVELGSRIFADLKAQGFPEGALGE